MRSRIKPGLVGRCPRCWIRNGHCICPEVPTVTTRTEIVLLRHHWETRKTTGTARMAELALSRCETLEFGYDPTLLNRVLAGLESAWVLYPDGDSGLDLTRTPAQLVVLDGTWAQTRRMMRRLTSLHRLPCLALPPKPSAPLRLRSPTRAGGRSTLEAIADALALLEGRAVAAPLERLHERYVEQVLRSRGHWTDTPRPGPEAATATPVP